VAGPISETLGFRVAAKYSTLKGWFKNRVPAGPSLTYPGFNTPGALYKTGPGTEQIIGRVTLKWQPSSDFSATLKVTGNQTNGNSVDNSEVYCIPGSVAALRGTSDTLAYGQFVANGFTTPTYIVDPNSDCKLDRKTSRGQLPTEFLANW